MMRVIDLMDGIYLVPGNLRHHSLPRPEDA
jgi:hypothetical protein